MMRLILLSLLTWALFGFCESDAEAQTRTRDARIDRIDRISDRIAVRDRAIERTDRARDRVGDRTPVEREPSPNRDPAPIDDIDPVRPDVPEDDIEQTADRTEVDGRMIVLSDRNFPVRRGQILSLGLSHKARQTIEAQGFRITRQTPLSNNSLYVIIAEDITETELLEQMLLSDPAGIFTLNHVYRPTGQLGKDKHSASPENESIEYSSEPTANLSRVGIIDGQIQADHARLASHLAASREFSDKPSSKVRHGTAVALRLAENISGRTIYAASVLSGEDVQWADAAAITAALDWLSLQNVSAINISLAGPPNDIVAQMVSSVQSKGAVIIAAVGNGGPLSQAIYPAAYPGVIGVTAIDPDGEIYPLATRGAHVDLAALGVDILIDGDIHSGTSFAAPIVTALYFQDPNGFNLRLETAKDLGLPGRDDVFGYGQIDAKVEMLSAASE